jgi:hypothetical protein
MHELDETLSHSLLPQHRNPRSEGNPQSWTYTMN